MKKFTLKLITLIFSTILFTQNIAAAPLDDFISSFRETTQNCKYNFDFDSVEKISKEYDNVVRDKFFNGNEKALLAYVNTNPYEYFFPLSDFMISKLKLATCREFSFYFYNMLNKYGIENWFVVLKPELLGGGVDYFHIANIYLDPNDKQLYVADGAVQSQLNMGRIKEEKLNIGKNDDRSIFMAHIPLQNYCNIIEIDKNKLLFGKPNNYGEWVTYSKFLDQYLQLLKRK